MSRPVELPGQLITAAMQLTGEQRVNVSVHHGGTPEAVVTVAIGRSVLYLRTETATRALGAVWRDALQRAAQLPAARMLTTASNARPEVAQPSVIVHTAGRPACTVRLSPAGTGTPQHLIVMLGPQLRFALYDQRAVTSCAQAFAAAARLGRNHLPRVEPLHIPSPAAEPALDGLASRRAREAFTDPPDSERAAPSAAARAAAAALALSHGCGAKHPPPRPRTSSPAGVVRRVAGSAAPPRTPRQRG